MEPLVAQAPTLDGAYWLALVSRVLHILGAIVLVGGIAYLRKVVAPGMTAGEDPEGARLYSGRRKAWAKWVGIATAVLLVTGFYNFFVIINTTDNLPGAYHPLFGVKFLLALVVFALAALLAGKTSAAQRFRMSPKKWLTLCLAAGIATVIAGSVLRSLHLATPSEVAPAATAED
jgi:uncharacterized membrane protein